MAEATDAEIDKVREIAGENDYDHVAEWIVALTDGQWDRALELIDAWDQEYPPSAPGVSVRGGSRAVFYLPTEAGNDIRSRMRLLLGQPEVRDASITGGPGTQAVVTEWTF